MTTIHALIGGLHLSSTSAEQKSQIIEDLRRYEIKRIAASHCTGQAAISELINSFGSAVTSADVSCGFQF
jgi:7,8-dihydropterin-6-yl-methyl-4-(beta-D-ribofuranosyl)aminobenzene 5'-phosphate synthase